MGAAAVVVAAHDDDSIIAKTTTMMTTMDGGGVERRSSTSSGTPHSLDLPPVPAVTVVEQVEDPSQVVRIRRVGAVFCFGWMGNW
jgi:hypothetical protein